MKKETAMTAPATARYYVGDLCYVLDNDVWNEVCNQTPFDNSTFEFELSDGRKYLLFSTAYGDGTYNDNEGNPYSVDSGTIGAIKVDDIVDTKGLNNAVNNGLGHIRDLPAEIDEINCEYYEGTIYIHNVVIYTGNDYDLDDEEEFEDDEDA